MVIADYPQSTTVVLGVVFQYLHSERQTQQGFDILVVKKEVRSYFDQSVYTSQGEATVLEKPIRTGLFDDNVMRSDRVQLELREQL